MVFSSLSFLFLFLPAVLLVYFAVPRQGKNLVLFLFSLLFYAWGEPVYVLLMIFSTVLDYTCGRLVDKFRGKSEPRAAVFLQVFRFPYRDDKRNFRLQHSAAESAAAYRDFILHLPDDELHDRCVPR